MWMVLYHLEKVSGVMVSDVKCAVARRMPGLPGGMVRKEGGGEGAWRWVIDMYLFIHSFIGVWEFGWRNVERLVKEMGGKV